MPILLQQGNDNVNNQYFITELQSEFLIFTGLILNFIRLNWLPLLLIKMEQFTNRSIADIDNTPINIVSNNIVPKNGEQPILESDNGFNSSIGGIIQGTSSLIATKTICFTIVIAYNLIVYLVFGKLRANEQQRLRKAFWDYFIQKFIFIMVILDAKSYHDRLPWAIWYTAIGSILLLSTLCRDRFEYLSVSPSNKNWSLLKIDILMGILLVTIITTTFNVLIKNWSTNVLFLLADSTYTLTLVTSVIWRFIVLTYDMKSNSEWENRATIIYYSDLVSAITLFTIDALHNLHLLFIGSAIPLRFWCLRNIHKIIMDIRRRYKRHKNYLLIVHLMETNFPMASQEDIDKNSDDCAICWAFMKSARKLPCGHLFHNSCLRSWLEQDTSCPTCRTSLKAHQDGLIDEIDDRSDGEEEFIDPTRTHQRSHFFHFDSSRYTNNPFLSWLPTISIEGFM